MNNQAAIQVDISKSYICPVCGKEATRDEDSFTAFELTLKIPTVAAILPFFQRMHMACWQKAIGKISKTEVKAKIEEFIKFLIENREA